jgi:TM2 domain-containing membrane protein YozV
MQAPSQKKSEGLAAVASFLFSGLGQVYNGSFVRGLCILIGAMIGSLFFFIPGLLIWAYGIYDAYATAKKMNEGLIPFVPHEMSHIIGFIILGIVIVIIYFVILVAAFSALMLGASSFY